MTAAPMTPPEAGDVSRTTLSTGSTPASGGISDPFNVLSLFAGIGGLELGLERAGMTVVGQVEIDPYCRRVLAKHWPEVPRHDDVRTCVEWWLSRPRPRVDLVCGGFPCQPVSQAGRRLGEADERWLWPLMAAVVRVLRPRFVFVENVAALTHRGRGMGTVLGGLAALGYDAEWDCIPASALGAPHERDRVWIVAYPDGEGQSQSSRSVGQVRRWVGDSRQPLANANVIARPERWPSDTSERQGGRHTDQGGFGTALADAESIAERAGLRSVEPRIFGRGRSGDGGGPHGVWSPEPDVGRVAHGVPARMDRLRALGNAVVPAVAEYVGRLILAAHLAAEVAS